MNFIPPKDWLDDLVNGPGDVVDDEVDDFFEEDSMTKISEFDFFRYEDSKDSDCFMSDIDEDSICSSPSGPDDNWIEMFDFFFSLAEKKYSAKLE